MEKLTLLLSNLENSLSIAKEEYLIKPTNPLYSIITDLELTIAEVKKLM